MLMLHRIRGVYSCRLGGIKVIPGLLHGKGLESYGQDDSFMMVCIIHEKRFEQKFYKNPAGQKEIVSVFKQHKKKDKVTKYYHFLFQFTYLYCKNI